MRRFVLAVTLSAGMLSAASGETFTPGQTVDKDFAGFAKGFLKAHCVDCHGKTDPEGKLSLHDLGPVEDINASTWKRVWAQVTLKEMPPKDMDQPAVVQRLQFSDWIVAELTRDYYFYQLLLFGLVIVFTVLFMPKGIGGIIERYFVSRRFVMAREATAQRKRDEVADLTGQEDGA